MSPVGCDFTISTAAAMTATQVSKTAHRAIVIVAATHHPAPPMNGSSLLQIVAAVHTA